MYTSSGINFTDPARSVERLRLEPGMRVADFGAGSGAICFALAKVVGSKGLVYAIDIQKDLLDKLKSEARRRAVGNIETLWGDIDHVGGVKLADHTVNAVVVSNVLFQVDAKYQLAKEAHRVLMPGGRVLIVDWSESFGGMGPQPDHVVAADQAKDIFVQAGFAEGESFVAGPHHYGLVMIKK